MKLIKKLKEKKGFTLVESVVSIAILSLASLTFAIFLATSNRMTMATIQNEQDYAILQEAISTIKIDPTQKKGTIVINGKLIEGEVITKEENGENVSFTLDFGKYFIDDTIPDGQVNPNAIIKVEGRYLVVNNPETGQHFAMFVPLDKRKNANVNVANAMNFVQDANLTA